MSEGNTDGRLHTPVLAPDERERLYTLHAEMCKALAHPKRLEMLDLLGDGELTVEEIAVRVGLQSSNVSQHLATLRRVGLVTNRKEGLYVHYRIADSRILGVCGLLREILTENIRHGQQLVGR